MLQDRDWVEPTVTAEAELADSKKIDPAVFDAKIRDGFTLGEAALDAMSASEAWTETPYPQRAA